MSEAPSEAKLAPLVGAEFRRRPEDDARHPSVCPHRARRARGFPLAFLAALALLAADLLPPAGVGQWAIRPIAQG